MLKDNLIKIISNIDNISFKEKVILFKDIDRYMLDINKLEYNHTKDILQYIKNTKMPILIKKENITLLALIDYFNQSFIAKRFIINMGKYTQLNNTAKIFIDAKLNNFPHLVGISTFKVMKNNTISKKIPKTFLDGVLYRWILIDDHKYYDIDFEKVEVFSWIKQTLVNPTYILSQDSIRKENTKFNADIIFIKRIIGSSKFVFHIVGIKRQKLDEYTFVSQFAIRKDRYKGIESMFDLTKAFYTFNKKALISSGQA
jgi:hypothetical protein